MKKLGEEIVSFFHNQGYVVVSTIDNNGWPHASCKGIVDIKKSGRVYLLDLYRGLTYENLSRNPKMSITAVNEHKFLGYCLKGKGRIVERENFVPSIVSNWESRITNRVTARLIRNIRGEKGHLSHPEAKLPSPAYMVVMDVERVVDLKPVNLD